MRILLVLVPIQMMKVSLAFNSRSTSQLVVRRFGVRRTFASRKDDFIDAEFIDANESNKQAAKKPASIKRDDSFMPPTDKKQGGLIGNIFNGISKVFGVDEKSVKKREQKKQMNTAIDKIFEGTGLAGGLIGGLMKGVGGMVAEMMTENANDLEVIQEKTVRYLESNPVASSLLGESIRCGPPLQSSSSSMNANGVTSKFLAFVMSVQGDRGIGSVRVQATVKGTALIITELVFQGPDGRAVNIARGPGPNSNGYIDVEAL